MKTTQILTPRAMIVVYLEEGKKLNDRIENDDVFIEYAAINSGKPGPLTPMSARVANGLGKTMMKGSTITMGGFLPRNLIFIAQTDTVPTMIWWTKPQLRVMQFIDTMHIPKGKMMVPGMIWYYHDRNLQIFGVKDKIGPNTRLYRAPFHNTQVNGTVCLGAGVKQIDTDFSNYIGAIAAVEEAFFYTQFTETHHSSQIDGNLNSVMKSLIGTDKPFPLNKLLPLNITLKELPYAKGTITVDTKRDKDKT